MVVYHQRWTHDVRVEQVFVAGGFVEHIRCQLGLDGDFVEPLGTWIGIEHALELVVAALARNRSIGVQLVVDVAQHRLVCSIVDEELLSDTANIIY